MRIAALQMTARAGDIEGNLAMIGEAIAEAAAQGAALLVTPELAVTAYGAGEALHDLAWRKDGPEVAALTTLAARHRVHLVVGFAERAGNAIYNSALLATHDGRRLLYRKCHLYGEYERRLFERGDELPWSTDLDGVMTGVLICYDVEFPEAVRRLALQGAQLILIPTALPLGEHAAFIAEKVVPVRAFENQVAIVYANHVGSDGRFTYAGRSCITMPDGTDAARAAVSGGKIIIADYDPERFSASRLANPYLVDQRADLYLRS